MHAVLITVALWSLIAASLARNITVSTSVGTIVGKTENISFAGTPLVVTKFLGIPFAEPPVGAKRFSKPEKKATFTEPFVADTMPPMCFQNLDYYGNLANVNITQNKVNESEDCLYLNVFLPGTGDVDTTKKHAVMIWIYGGGFQFGYQGLYNALAFPSLNDVILVTLNYRLSVLGFLSSGDSSLSGNYGLWDQHMAIRWVHDNIAHFGGDPMNVTIFGESAGATSVVYQSLYEGNKGLFKRAIAESGTVDLSLGQGYNVSTKFDQFVKNIGCMEATSTMTVECLKKLPFSAYVTNTKMRDTFYPVFDNDFMKVKPADIILHNTDAGKVLLKLFGNLDIILGVNSAEGAANIDLIERVIRAHNQDPSTGYTLEMFQHFIIPTMLSSERRQISDILTQAIVNQYVDWREPKDTNTMRQRAVDFMSDVMFNTGVISTANAHAKVNGSGRLYFYVYDHQLSFLPHRWYHGANHAEEVDIVLGFPSNYANGRPFTDDITRLPPEEISLSRQMMEYWTNFAKTGCVLLLFCSILPYSI